MTALNLVAPFKEKSHLGDEVEKRRLLLIESCRILFLMAILAVVIGFQIYQSPFINTGVWIPFQVVLFLAFVFNCVYLFLFHREMKWHFYFNSALFVFDALLVTTLIYYTGISQSVFLFLYLVNILLCGLVFQRRGSLLLATWTSILFSGLMIVGPPMSGAPLYFVVILNNLGFFAVAFFGGLLSEQLNFMGSELLEREKDVKTLQDLNQMIVENIATGLMTTQLDGIVTQCNQAGQKILEIHSLIGKSIYTIFPTLSSEIQWSDFLKGEASGKNGKISQRIEAEYKNYRQEKSIIELMFGPLRDNDREIIGYVFTFQDLTQIKKIEYVMRQQEKLAAVGQLAAGIAHEIRNPLASISGSIQLLSQSSFSSSSSPEEKKLFSIVLKEIDRLNDLISEFLDYVRPEPRISDPIHLNQLVGEVIEFVKHSSNIKVPVQQVLEMKSGRMIFGHKDKLRQAILNIVINAYQAMEKVEHPVLKITTMDLDLMNKVQLRIEDNGCGISEENRHRIFEPFHTTKTNGTGLGLAMTHKILENHEATVSVESTLNKGTVFIIEFPSPDREGEKPRLRIA